MTPFNLKIITPNEVFFEGETSNLIVRTTVGDKGILARHEPYLAALPIGTMRVKDENGKFRTAAISNGTIRVEDGGDTVVLVQSCEWGDEIDVGRAEVAKKAAEEIISDAHASQLEHDIAEFKLKRALNRIHSAENVK
ncbi:MAG: ATP synthase F1 subunit epsilon [Oscillospiraceae bacterium]|nr:ATP synthase F1 subunit epsilon [Oscillospiraceae bacterium]